MTFASINIAYNDQQLRDRVNAAVYREAYSTKSETHYGKQVLQGIITTHTPIYWGVASDTEAAYASALQAGRGAPGNDSDVITDAALTASIVAHWPPDPEMPTP